MENLKNIIMSSEFISLFIVSGLMLAIFYKVIERYKFKEKFYRAVLNADYIDLLYFYLLGINRPSWHKKILTDYYFAYERWLERGLYRYFDSRLNVRVTESRVSIMKWLIEKSREYAESNAPKMTQEQASKYFSLVNTQLRSVISDLPPAYFASCYVSSLANEKDSEGETRSFLLGIYSALSGSNDESRKKQAESFVELVNREIDKYMTYNISQEKKDLLHIGRLSISKKTETKELSFVVPQMY